jgi:hypothetical protein
MKLPPDILLPVRCIVVTITHDARQPTEPWVAKAGGRSTVASAATMTAAITNASRRIENYVPFDPHATALWLNDTTHWVADQRLQHPEILVALESALSSSSPRPCPGWGFCVPADAMRPRERVGFGYGSEAEAWVHAIAEGVVA